MTSQSELQMLSQLQAAQPQMAQMAKTGAFRSWREDESTVEIYLPMGQLSKKEVSLVVEGSASIAVTNKALRRAQKLTVKNKTTDETLLFVDPLAGLVDNDATTWTLDAKGGLNVSLAKVKPAAGTPAAQGAPTAWGETLCANGGVQQCYKTVEDVALAIEQRTAHEREREKERRERVEASHRKLREKTEAEAAARIKEEAAERAAAQKVKMDRKTSARKKLAIWDQMREKTAQSLKTSLPLLALMMLYAWYQRTWGADNSLPRPQAVR